MCLLLQLRVSVSALQFQHVFGLGWDGFEDTGDHIDYGDHIKDMV